MMFRRVDAVVAWITRTRVSYHMSTRAADSEAGTRLPALLRRVAAGEHFVITKHGRPVAELRPIVTEAKPAATDAIALVRALPKIRGVSPGIVRELVEKGRR